MQQDTWEKVNGFAKHYRDTTVIETLGKIGMPVTLCGWLCRIRNHGHVLFLELRDHTGVLQLVVEKPTEEMKKLNMESVIQVIGVVRSRPESQTNHHIHTGKLEVVINHIILISDCLPLPFQIEDSNVGDDVSLKHRYLSLRSEKMQYNLKLRSELNKYIRHIMDSLNFTEVVTPLLTADSPEGARNFVVPSRLHPGKAYVLPQSPQIFKQLLMVGGVNRYYQLAPCFRAEDTRIDRCPGEFYQLDLECAFVLQDDIFKLLLHIITNILEKFNPNKTIYIHNMTYNEAMEKYGTDKPNLNSPLFIEDFTHIFARSAMQLFIDNINNKQHKIKGFRCKISNPDKVMKEAEKLGWRMAYVHNINNELKGPIGKFLPIDICHEGEVIFFVSDVMPNIYKKLSTIMKYVAEEYDLLTHDHHVILVKDFPFFELDDNGNWAFTHNPFSMPQTEDWSDPSQVKAYQYDVVLNGFEIASGSIRNHKSDLLVKAFMLCGYSKEAVFENFSAMVNAFNYGVPPHGGAAFGIERIMMILTDSNNIRQMSAFPLNNHGRCMLTNAPAPMDPKTMREFHLILKTHE